MVIEIEIPTIALYVLVCRLRDDGFMTDDEVACLIEAEVHAGGHDRLVWLLSCDSQEIRTLCRAYQILWHGA